MPAAPDPDHRRLEMIVHLAMLIRSELDKLTKTAFFESRDLIDLVAYRLGSAGEYGGKLSAELKARHPHIDWRGMYNMRNALFHDYEGVLASQVWDAAGEPLLKLVDICRIELAARETTGSPAASP